MFPTRHISSEAESAERLLTVREAARLLHVTERSIWNWIAAGLLQAVHLGRATRLRKSDVDRAMQVGIGSQPGPGGRS